MSWDNWNQKKKDWEKKTGYQNDAGDKFMKGLTNVKNEVEPQETEPKKTKSRFEKVRALFGSK